MIQTKTEPGKTSIDQSHENMVRVACAEGEKHMSSSSPDPCDRPGSDGMMPSIAIHLYKLADEYLAYYKQQGRHSGIEEDRPIDRYQDKPNVAA